MTRYTKFDLKKEFQKFFNEEQDDFEIRSEKFYVYCEAGVMREKRILEWLEEAYIAGARDMAQDTLNTLGDYACFVAGLEPELIKPEEVFDRAGTNLMVYYTKVLDGLPVNKLKD